MNIDACHKSISQIHATQEIMIRKLNTIINLLTNEETESHAASKEDTHLLPEFPLSTTKDLLKFEEDLQIDKDIRRQFVGIHFLHLLKMKKIYFYIIIHFTHTFILLHLFTFER